MYNSGEFVGGEGIDAMLGGMLARYGGGAKAPPGLRARILRAIAHEATGGAPGPDRARGRLVARSPLHYALPDSPRRDLLIDGDVLWKWQAVQQDPRGR